MSYFWPFSGWSVPQGLQKRLLKFLLKRAIGQFLAAEIDLENLDVEFGKGQVVLKDLELNLEVLNDLVADLPVVVTSGSIKSIQAYIPWKDLSNSSCTLELDGLNIEVASVADDPENGLSKSSQMSDSHIMSSSIHFAENFLRSEATDDDEFSGGAEGSGADDPGASSFSNGGVPPGGLEGLQVLAGVIDKILAKVKFTVRNTKLRFCHSSPHSMAKGVPGSGPHIYYLDFDLSSLAFQDETPEADVSNASLPSAPKVKTVRFSGLTVSLNQLHPESIPAEPNMPAREPTFCFSAVLASTAKSPDDEIRILIDEGNHTDQHLRQNMPVRRPRVEVDISIFSICALILPYHHSILMEMVSSLQESILILAQSRQFEQGSEDINMSNLSRKHRSMSSSSPPSDIQQDWGSRGYPAAGEFVNNSDTPLPKSLRIHIRTAHAHLYLVTSLAPPVIDESMFFITYFSGRRDVLHSDLSRSFITKVNTRLNAGKLSVDVMLGELIGADHIKIALHGILAAYGKAPRGRRRSRSPDDISELYIAEAGLSEWVQDTDAGPKSTPNSYQPIVMFDVGANTDEIRDLYAQLGKPVIPASSIYKPSKAMPTLRNDVRSPVVGETSSCAIVVSLQASRASFSDHSSHIRPSPKVSVKLAPVNVYINAAAINRVLRLVKTVDTEATGEGYTSSSPFDDTPVGNIMDDLAGSNSSLDMDNGNRTFQVQIALLRCWLNVAEPTSSIPYDSLLLDLIDVDVSTSLEVTEHTSKRRGSLGSLHQPLGTCSTHGLNESRRWSLSWEVGGVALVNSRASPSGLTIQPFMLMDKSATTSPLGQTGDSRPSIDVTLRSHVCDELLERPSLDLHAASGGFTLNRESSEEDLSPYGLQSWLDVGKQSAGSPKRKGESSEDKDLLWFKQRAIQESLVHIDGYVPTCCVNLTKDAYDGLQVLLSVLAPYQEESAKTEIPAPPLGLSMPLIPVLEFRQPDTSTTFPESYTTSQESQKSPVRRDPSTMTLIVNSNAFSAVIHAADAEEKPDPDQQLMYTLDAEDLRLFVVNGHEGKPTTYIWIDAQDLSVIKTSKAEQTPSPCLDRTLPHASQPQQMLSVSFSLKFDEELNMKETWASFNLHAFTLRSAAVLPLARDLGNFFKEPPEVALVDTASRFTKLHVNLLDGCVDYSPVDIPSRAVLVLDSVKISCDLIPESPTVSVKVLLYNACIFAIEDDSKRKEVELQTLGGFMHTKKHWTNIGFAHVLACNFLELSLRTNSGSISPSLEIDVTNNQLSLDTCADSFQTLISLIKNIGDSKGSEDTENPPVNRHPEPVATMLSGNHDDLIASLEEDVFGGVKSRSAESLRSRRDSYDLQMESIDNMSVGRSIDGSSPESESFSPGTSDDFDFGIGESAITRPHGSSPGKSSQGGNAENERTRVFGDQKGFTITENYFAQVSAAAEKRNMEGNRGGEKSMFRVRLHDLDIVWNIYDGYDWEAHRDFVFQRSHAQKADKPHQPPSDHGHTPPNRMQRAASFGSAGSSPSGENGMMRPTLWRESSTELGVPIENNAFEIAHQFLPTLQQGSSATFDNWRDHDDTVSEYSTATGVSSRPQEEKKSKGTRRRKVPTSVAELVRTQTPQIMFRAYAVNINYDTYSATAQTAWELDVNVRDFEIIDNLSTSRWRKFLSYMRPEGNAAPRETSSKIIKVNLSSVRPIPEPNGDEELRLNIELLPLRMHVDQDALTCLIRFFTYEHPFPPSPPGPPAPDNTFFQLCDIQPLSLKIDYKPKHVDYANLKGGNFIEILNFFPLEGALMNLRGVRLTGVKGFDRILDGIFKQWLPHIRDTQLPNMASGVTGVKSIVNLGSGIADLVLLPIEQYKKDGRILRGLQKGAKSFAKAATTETIKMGTKLAVGTQVLLEQADEILGGEGGGSNGDNTEYGFGPSGSADQISKYSEQPLDMREGVELGWKGLSRNVATAARTVLAVPTEVYENTGTQGTVRAVIRAVPVAVLRPMIGATEAVSKTLMGLQNSMDPSRKASMEDKYKG
ncbi:uncharacterized protein EV422DRAFT_519800 [Fimicolochytrium jonesii]|uniref:uncharacterized protein n=1 Tax=Fimicolochytrium jonesii TaxID=1396493 RepID=UPI0022FDF7C3|nr:uncharacterized protein EV422DRAFT_519800 [Fimicolochytrium jonesii]KAI8824336.1 hypothetical protein EV422DRAFT_519800 [Fimicolochytrium jonesii]